MPVASQLQTVVNHYRAQLARHETEAEQALSEAYQRAEAALQPQLARLYQQMATRLADGEGIPLWWLMEDGRLATIKQFITSQMNHYGSVSQITVQQLQLSGLTLAREAALAQLSAILPNGLNWQFAPPPASAIEQLVGATQAGSPLADLFSGFGAEAAANAEQALINGVSLGESVADVARSLQQALEVERTRALTIARTEMLRSYRGGNLATFQANDDVCGQWRWCASKSGRTCAACLAMDGTLHSLDESMDSHVNCRCSPSPVPVDVAFQTPYQSGEDWLSGQTESVQRTVLGAKYAGWKQGDFSLQDMVGYHHSAQWGSSIYEKSLRQLQKKKAA